MRMLVVTHASFEKPGSIQSWAERNNYQITEIKPYQGDAFPDIDDFDFVVVMGGPQSPLEIDKAPYLKDEIRMLSEALQRNKRIIGVCLGAQLIGEAIGVKTERSPFREIGCYPLEMLPATKDDPIFSNFDSKVDVMHWHSDMPGIAAGAVLLAKSEGCPRQIYRYGDRVYGFQCHFELTKELVTEMTLHCSNDLVTDKYIMTKEEMMNVDYDAINAKMDMVLDYLAALPQPEYQQICSTKIEK